MLCAKETVADISAATKTALYRWRIRLFTKGSYFEDVLEMITTNLLSPKVKVAGIHRRSKKAQLLLSHQHYICLLCAQVEFQAN
jgi:hypothetical protein